MKLFLPSKICCRFYPLRDYLTQPFRGSLDPIDWTPFGAKISVKCYFFSEFMWLNFCERMIFLSILWPNDVVWKTFYQLQRSWTFWRMWKIKRKMNLFLLIFFQVCRLIVVTKIWKILRGCRLVVVNFEPFSIYANWLVSSWFEISLRYRDKRTGQHGLIWPVKNLLFWI